MQVSTKTDYQYIINLFIFVFLPILSFAQQKEVIAQGEIIKKEIDLEDNFNTLKTSASWEVELIKSDRPRLEVETHENILPFFDYKVKDNKLYISFKKNTSVKNVKTQKVKVYYKSLDHIKASSSSKITSDETFTAREIKVVAKSSGKINLKIKNTFLKLSASSSGKIETTGTTKYATIKAKSSGKIKAKKLKAKHAEIKNSSSGKIALQLNGEKVKAKIKSSGKTRLHGEAKKLTATAKSNGFFDGQYLVAEKAIVKASSGGVILVNSTKNLTAETTSGGRVEYSGNPSNLKKNKSLSGGKIKKR